MSASHAATAGSAASVASAAEQSPPQFEGDNHGEADLLQFYRRQAEAFDAERVQLLERVQAVEVQQEEMHKLRWELKVRDEAIEELQTAMSDATKCLYEERAQVVKLAAENDALRVQAREDAQRIEHLLALTEPVAQEVTFFRDCRPEAVTKYPMQSRSASGAAPQAAVVDRVQRGGRGGVRGGTAEAGATGGASAQKTRVLRTVYLPSERAEALANRVSVLERQLAEQEQLSEERLAAWRRDAEETARQTTERRDEMAGRIRSLERDLKSAKENLRLATMDLLRTRHSAQTAERQFKERAVAMRQQTESLEKQLGASRKAHREEATALRAREASKVAGLKSKMREERDGQQQNAGALRGQFEAVQAAHEQHVQELAAANDDVTARLQRLQRRRTAELEGFTADVAMLRRALRQLELQWAMVGQAAADGAGAAGLGPDQVDRIVRDLADKRTAPMADKHKESRREADVARSGQAFANVWEEVRSRDDSWIVKHQEARGARREPDSFDDYKLDKVKRKLEDWKQSRERSKRRSKGDRRDDSGSDDGSSRRRKHRKRSKKEKRHRRDKGDRRRGDRDRADSDDDDYQAAAAGSRRGAVDQSRYGKYGIIRASDYSKKEDEFECWLREVKGIPAFGGNKGELMALFEDYCEDYNTATLPSEKYYNLEGWQRQAAASAARQAASGASLGGSAFADEEAARQERRAAREAEERERMQTYLRTMDAGKARDMRRRQLLEVELQNAFRGGDHSAVERIKRKLEPEK